MAHLVCSVWVPQMLLVQLPQFGNLPTGDILEYMFVVLLVLQALVQLANRAVAVPTLDPLQEVRGGLVSGIPVSVAGIPLPVGWGVTGVQTDPI